MNMHMVVDTRFTRDRTDQPNVDIAFVVFRTKVFHKIYVNIKI